MSDTVRILLSYELRKRLVSRTFWIVSFAVPVLASLILKAVLHFGRSAPAGGIALTEFDSRVILSAVSWFVILMAVLVQIMKLGQGMVIERRSRIMEMILTSVSPRAFIASRVAAAWITGCIQFSLWLGVCAAFLAPDLSVHLRTSTSLSAANVAAWVGLSGACFVLGMFLYTSLSMVSVLLWPVSHDAQMGQVLLGAVWCLPSLLLMRVVLHPAGELAMVASLFPLTAPLLLPVRAMLAAPGAVEVIAGLASIAAAGILAVLAAERIVAGETIFG